MLDSQPLQDASEPLRQQYAELAQLAGGLVHEIRNPLSTMSLSLELLEEDLLEGDTPRERRMRQKVQVVRRECLRLEEILNAFLQFARLGQVQQQPANLNAVVEGFIEVVRPEAQDAGIEISPHLAANLPAVSLDVTLWRHVLENLVRNARQAMPHGGVLELQTAVEPGAVMLDIIDSGEGMDEATQARMFDAFYSTKKGGSGLGLPTVKRIVEAHGGTMSCDSAIGRGTRFRIRLPALNDAAR